MNAMDPAGAAIPVLEDLAGADWLVVPLPEDVRGKPKRWANSTTYKLFPWYVRPFKTVEVIMTAGSLEQHCRMSAPDLRFAFFRTETIGWGRSMQRSSPVPSSSAVGS
jgi:hypothetical protein